MCTSKAIIIYIKDLLHSNFKSGYKLQTNADWLITYFLKNHTIQRTSNVYAISYI